METKPRLIFVMLDGLGDHSHLQKDNTYKTPLQLAHTPNLDWLASQNVFGLHDPVQAGLACGSDTAHMSIFGYDPLKFYDGRGSFEAMGAGQQMYPGDIAFKSNFAYINPETSVVERRRVDRQFANWGVPLCGVLDGLPIPGFPDHVLKCQYATEHRCGVLIRGASLSSRITGTDPLKDNLRALTCEPINKTDELATLTSKIVNAASKEITRVLTEHPINVARRE